MGLRFLAAAVATASLATSPADASEVAAGARSPRQRGSVGEGHGFLDPTTKQCYEGFVGKGFSGFLKVADNQTAEGVTAESILRKDTTMWCAGDSGNDTDIYKPPPKPCGPPQMPDPYSGSPCDGEAVNCSRGYDLMQTPKDATCSSPRILFVHGGGWKSSTPFDAVYVATTSKIAKRTGAVVLSIDYPLIGAWEGDGSGDYVGNAEGMLKHALAAWEWLAGHGPGGKTCCSKTFRPPMFVGGDSSGGGTAMATLMKLLSLERSGDLGGKRVPDGGFFWSPWLNLASNTPTYYSNNFAAFPNKTAAVKDLTTGALTGDLMFNWPTDVETTADPLLTSNEMAKNALEYCGCKQNDTEGARYTETCTGTCGGTTCSEKQLRDPIFSAYNAPDELLQSMPPIYIAASGTENFAGDATVMAERSAQNGVHARAELFLGMWHVFPLFSEGCGSGQELWQGITVLQHVGDFVEEVSRALKECPSEVRRPPSWHRRSPAVPGNPAPVTLHQLSGMNGGTPLVPIKELGMDICGGRSPQLLATGGGWRQGSLRATKRHGQEGEEEASAFLQAPPATQEGDDPWAAARAAEEQEQEQGEL